MPDNNNNNNNSNNKFIDNYISVPINIAVAH